MNDGPQELHMGYLVEGLELLIRKVACTKYEATPLVRWSNSIEDLYHNLNRTLYFEQYYVSFGREPS
jgi:hypothetical protein